MKEDQMNDKIIPIGDPASVEVATEIHDYLCANMDPAQKNTFEQKIYSNPTLAQQVAEEKQLLKQISHSRKEFSVTDSALTKFNQCLDEAESSNANEITNSTSSYSSKDIVHEAKHSNGLSRFKSHLSAVAAVLLVALAVGIYYNPVLDVDHHNLNSEEFRTLSNNSDTALGNPSGRRYKVIFSDSLSLQGVDNLAQRYSFSLLNGPDEMNLYVIEFAQPLSSVELGLLRDKTDILFLEKLVE